MQVNFPTTGTQAVQITSKQTCTVQWPKLWFVETARSQQRSCPVLGKLFSGSLYDTAQGNMIWLFEWCVKLLPIPEEEYNSSRSEVLAKGLAFVCNSAMRWVSTALLLLWSWFPVLFRRTLVAPVVTSDESEWKTIDWSVSTHSFFQYS